MLWIVGPVFVDFHDYLVAQGQEYGVFHDATKPPRQAAKQMIALDFTHLETSLAALPSDLEVSSVLVAGYEQYVVPAAVIAAHFGVPGPSFDSARAATDKALMRAAFQAADPSITPPFRRVNSWQDAADFVSEHGLPVVLKPGNLMKSLYVTKNYGFDELRANYDDMVAALPAIYTDLPSELEPEIIIEGFLDGTMHTVAGCVDANGVISLVDQIVDCLPAPGAQQQDSYLYSRQLPTRLSVDDQAAVLDVARRGTAALGLSATSLHIELIFTADGPKLIEIGARIGGYRTRMYAQACGLNLYQAAIDVAESKAVTFSGELQGCFAVLELFPDQDGPYSHLEHEAELRNLPSFHYLSIKRKVGETVGRASHGYRAVAVVMLQHADAAQFERDLAFIAVNVSVQTD